MINDTQLARDNEGYLLDPEEWNESLAYKLAEEEGLELDQSYLSIIQFMRRYWAEHQVAPDVRHVVHYLVNEQGYDKKRAKADLFTMFPYGYVKQACKIAGMLKPRAWSTG